MSVAKITTVKSARKDQGKCEKCGDPIQIGDEYIWFKVGFRSNWKRVRCTKSSCYPKPSERESSMLADVYAAQEGFDVEGYTDIEEIQSALQDVANTVREVAEQYQSASENDYGVVFNTEAAERAEILESSADELDSWEPDSDAEGCEKHDENIFVHEQDDTEERDEVCVKCQDNFDTWITDQRAAAYDLVNSIETG